MSSLIVLWLSIASLNYQSQGCHSTDFKGIVNLLQKMAKQYIVSKCKKLEE